MKLKNENWNHFLLWWSKEYWSFAKLLMIMSSLLTMHQETPFFRWSINTEFSVLQPAVCAIVSATGWNIVECEPIIEIHKGATSQVAINQTVSAAGNEIFHREPRTLCQRFVEMKSFRHSDGIHSYYIVLC